MATNGAQNIVTAASGKVLQGAGIAVAPTWSTPTYPSASGTSRKILVSDGTNNVYSTETWAVPGTSGNVLTSDGTNWTSASNTGPAGGVIQQKRASSTATTALTSGWTVNNTIPTTSLGVELFNVSITPTNTNSILVIEGCLQVGWNGIAPPGVSWGVFQDSTSNALFAGAWHYTDQASVANIAATNTMVFKYYMTAGTTSSTAIKLRAGCDNNTAKLNTQNNASTRLYGGVCQSTFFITEWKA